MSLIGSNILVGASGNQGGYQISRSVRLRASASAYLNRTFSTPTDNKKWTYSVWFKRGQLTYGGSGGSGALLFAPSSGNTFGSIYLTPTDIINWYDASGGATVYLLQTTQVFRDPSAWYHLVFTYDSTQATAANRQKMYLNGVQITTFSTASYVAQNTNGRINSAVIHEIGRNSAVTQYYDGYLTETNFIDGQALTPTSFGEFNAITGVWQPKKYAGTYGTNGFYLNFSDNSAATAAAIGKDYSGNGNNWTPNNISVTAGVTYDSMIDTPTPYADGGNGRGNYAVLNPLDNSNFSVSNGNLKATGTTSTWQAVRSTFAYPSGSWYTEIFIDVGISNGNNFIGITRVSDALSTMTGSNLVGTASTAWGYSSNGNIYNSNAISTATGITWAANDIVAVAFDGVSVKFYKNNSLVHTQSSLTGEYVLTLGAFSTGAFSVNFGQRPFTYTPPTGFKALNTQNLPASTIENGAKQFNINLSAATSATRTVTGFAFAPDLVIAKNRSYIDRWGWGDSVRGANKTLASNLSNAEVATTDTIMSFNSDGFTLGADATAYGWNYNRSGNSQYAYWAWKAGGAAVTNTAGSISSQVSANTSAGFSVVTYTGTGAAATVGHGLGVAPAMIINKSRNAAQDWFVFNKNLANMTNAFLKLNTTAAVATIGSAVAAPTSTTFGVSASITDTSTYVAYCFAEVAGYSKFGSYTGNGSTDGTFVYLGFRPRFVMIKRTDSTGNWAIWDTARDTFNATKYELVPNASDAETSAAGDRMDILSNGFKLRNTGVAYNASGGTYIYACFAENPFSKALAR